MANDLTAEQKYQVKLTDETLGTVKKLFKKNKNDKIRDRLQIIHLRYKGYPLQEISEVLVCSIQHVKDTISIYNHQGIKSLLLLKYIGDPGNLTSEEKKTSASMLRTSIQAGLSRSPSG